MTPMTRAVVVPAEVMGCGSSLRVWLPHVLLTGLKGWWPKVVLWMRNPEVP